MNAHSPGPPRPPRASDAQARTLARIWSERKPWPDWGNCPTRTALIRKGLLEPTGEVHQSSLSIKPPLYRISPAGVLALANYLAWAAGKASEARQDELRKAYEDASR